MLPDRLAEVVGEGMLRIMHSEPLPLLAGERAAGSRELHKQVKGGHTTKSPSSAGVAAGAGGSVVGARALQRAHRRPAPTFSHRWTPPYGQRMCSPAPGGFSSAT